MGSAEIDRWKVHRIVELLKCNRVELDYFQLVEVENEPWYWAELGCFEELTRHEKEVLRSELLKLAEQQDFAEVTRLVMKMSEDPEGLLQRA